MLNGIRCWSVLLIFISGPVFAQQGEIKTPEAYSAAGSDVLSCMQNLVNEIFKNRKWKGMKWYRETGYLHMPLNSDVQEVPFTHEFSVEDFAVGDSKEKIKDIRGQLFALYKLEDTKTTCRLNTKLCHQSSEGASYYLILRDGKFAANILPASIKQPPCPQDSTLSRP